MANILETVVFADGETANTQQATGTQTAADPNATQQVNPVMSTIVSILPLVLIIVLLYFMMIRPQRKKEKEKKACADHPGESRDRRGGRWGDQTETQGHGPEHVTILQQQ